MKKRPMAIISAAAALAAAACAVWLETTATREYAGEEAVRIYIPAGSDAPAIGDTLRNRLGEKTGEAVLTMWRLRRGQAERATGSYVIEPGDRAWSVASRLKSGRQTPIRVTFNNVRLLRDLGERVSARFAWDADDFAAAADTILPKHGFRRKEQYAAAFVPDTYEFYWTDNAGKVVEKLVGERNRFWNDERRGKASALGLTPVEAATIASIVEEETAKSDEKGKVARLYLNRLKEGMKLQADPTVKYAVGDFTLRRIRGEHLTTESAYNTYQHTGLPPGPIRIAEKSTIDAVLDAPEHGYLYMCAKPDFSGYHNFARDYATHQKNAAAYRSELNRLNIR